LILLAPGCGGSSGAGSATSTQTESTITTAAPQTSAKTLTELRAAARAKRKRRERTIRRRAESRLKKEATRRRAERAKVQKAKQSHSFHNEARACGSYSGKDRFACEDSYEICSAEAPRVVEKSYHEEGPNFEEWAVHYAKETYIGHANPYEDLVWQAGYAGCLEAMAAESEKLYG
jgi:hypothetical protein